jgi:hypothetical protein
MKQLIKIISAMKQLIKIISAGKLLAYHNTTLLVGRLLLLLLPLLPMMSYERVLNYDVEWRKDAYYNDCKFIHFRIVWLVVNYHFLMILILHRHITTTIFTCKVVHLLSRRFCLELWQGNGLHRTWHIEPISLCVVSDQ